MTTLITGGTGFLGRHVVELLLDQNDTDLRILTTGPRPDWLRQTDVQIVTGSITDVDVCKLACDGVDKVYHLAGRVSRSREDARPMYEVHVDGTRTLLDAAEAAGVSRIILASTSGTLAVSESDQDLATEESPAPVEIIGRWPYYASKLYQEQLALRRCEDAGIELCVLNPSLLLGPGDDRLSSTIDVLRFMEGDIPVVPTGGLNFVDVRDVAGAFITAMAKGKPGERYLLGGTNWTFRAFFGRLSRMTKVSAPKFMAPSSIAVWGARAMSEIYNRFGRNSPVDPVSVEMAQYFWYFDDAKARADLDFAPRDPSDTLYDTVQYIRSGQMSD